VTERFVTHSTFTVERTYDAVPARVFNAFADPKIKARWFFGPDNWGPEIRELDFRVGGREINRGGAPDGSVYTFQAHYMDIVRDNRIVYAYDMHIDETRISASLATVELTPVAEATRLVYTEQGAFLDGLDTADSRTAGTGTLLDALGAELKRQAIEEGA
jgi:uncharacterized protein YndB with AHSA1/START domain